MVMAAVDIALARAVKLEKGNSGALHSELTAAPRVAALEGLFPTCKHLPPGIFRHHLIAQNSDIDRPIAPIPFHRALQYMALVSLQVLARYCVGGWEVLLGS